MRRARPVLVSKIMPIVLPKPDAPLASAPAARCSGTLSAVSSRLHSRHRTARFSRNCCLSAPQQDFRNSEIGLWRHGREGRRRRHGGRRRNRGAVHLSRCLSRGPRRCTRRAQGGTHPLQSRRLHCRVPRAGAVDLRSALSRIKKPTLVMVGELDAATPLDLARELAPEIKGARFVLLPGCGHCPLLEQPEAFLAAIGCFLGPLDR